MSLTFIVYGCNKNSIDEINPLKINKQLVLLDKETTVGKLHIMTGNGGYTLVFPKQISVDALQVDYSESIVKLSIDNDDNIVIERRLLTDQNVSGLFILKDSKE